MDKGLLRETEIVQHQITALLKCDVSLLHIEKDFLLITSGPGQRTRERDHYHCISNACLGSSGYVPCYEPSHDQHPR